MYTTTITKSGQITLTKAAREKLGVKPGDKVYVDFEDDKLKVERKMTDEEFLEKLNALGSPVRKDLLKKHAGKTVREYQNLPEYKTYYKEKYAL